MRLRTNSPAQVTRPKGADTGGGGLQRDEVRGCATHRSSSAGRLWTQHYALAPANRQPPPTANRQRPPPTANHQRQRQPLLNAVFLLLCLAHVLPMKQRAFNSVGVTNPVPSFLTSRTALGLRCFARPRGAVDRLSSRLSAWKRVGRTRARPTRRHNPLAPTAPPTPLLPTGPGSVQYRPTRAGGGGGVAGFRGFGRAVKMPMALRLVGP